MRRSVGALSLGVCAVALTLPTSGANFKEVTVYAIDYPPIPFVPSLPADYVCVTVRTVEPIDFVAPPPGPGGGGNTPTVWMTPHDVRYGPPDNPLYEQGALQFDNPLFESITGFAIGVPQVSPQSPVLATYQPTGPLQGGLPWQMGVVHRTDWDNNVWASRAVTDRMSYQGALPEWLPPVAPLDWSPAATGQGPLQFDTVFGPQFGSAVMMWTPEQSHGIPGQSSHAGFALVGAGLSREPLPWIAFGPQGVLATGQLVLTCPCERDGDTSMIGVNDLLSFLADWFAMDIAADWDGDEVISVNDLLGFLACWFQATGPGCA